MESSLELRRFAYVRVVLAVLVIALVIAFVASGAHRQLSLEGLQSAVREAGPLGVFGFLLAFALLQPLHVSSHIFVLAASMLWPWHVAFALSWLGAMMSTHLAFGAARWLGRDAVLSRLPERFRGIEERLAGAGIRSIIVLKLLFFTTPAVQFGLGISRVSWRTFALGTALGNVPGIALDIAIGSGAVAWLT